MFKKPLVALTLIFLLSLILRIYRLGEIPPSLNWDEVSHGYNAYSVLKTASDEWGEPFPWDNFRAYGDYPLPVSLYLITPSIVAFGLTGFAVRFPSALLGALIIVPQYFLTYLVTKNRKASLFSALLIGIIPWTILPSRGVFQSTIALFFIVSSLALLFASEINAVFLPLAVLALAISAYSYHNARIVAILFLPFLALYFLKIIAKVTKVGKATLTATLILAALFFVPLVFVVLSPAGHARANWVFLIDQGAINQLDQLRTGSSLPPTLTRLIYNRLTYLVVQGTKNYLEYFTPQFLFIQGGTQYQYSVPNWGLLNWILLPFLYAGLIWSIKKSFEGNPRARLITLFVLLAPLPAAITLGEFHVLRSNLLLPGLLVGSAITLVGLFEKLEKHPHVYFVCAIVVIVGLLVPLELYLNDLFTTYSVKYSWSWQYGYKQVIEFAKENYNRYDRIIITKKYGEPHEFFLFFWPWNPASYKSDPHLVRYFRSDWYWVDGFDKFVFVNDWEIKSKEESLVIPGKTLLVTSPDNYSGGQKLKTIDFLDGLPAFDIVAL